MNQRVNYSVAYRAVNFLTKNNEEPRNVKRVEFMLTLMVKPLNSTQQMSLGTLISLLDF